MKYITLTYLYILYPLITFLFASQASILHDNLSHVGNLEGMRLMFILWAITCEIALAIGFIRCLKKVIYRKTFTLFILMNAILFLLSVCLPYLPEVFPILSNLHIDLSFISIYMILILIGILTLCLKMSFSIFPFEYFLLFIYGIAFMIFSQNNMSVNSLVEIFLAIMLPLYLYHLGGNLQ